MGESQTEVGSNKLEKVETRGLIRFQEPSKGSTKFVAFPVPAPSLPETVRVRGP